MPIKPGINQPENLIEQDFLPSHLSQLNYQIKTFSGVLWIIPSGAPDPSSAASVKLVIPYIAGTGLKPNTPAQDIDGTISLKWLPASNPTEAEITVPAEILFDADRDKLFSAWQQFLVNLDVQVSKHYMLPQAPALIRALLLQHMPLPQPEVKCYQLGFGYKDARYINLQAGMRLKLAFSNFYNEDSSGPGEKLKRFAGTGVSYAYVQAANNGDYLTFNSFMDLQQVSVAPQTSAPKIHVLASVLDLAAQTQNKYYRLYYPQEFTAVDKPEISIAHNVCLVGASNYNDLPELPVDTATNYSIGVFNGRCSVTPEILIKLNGKPVYVAVGATLSSLLERESVSGIVAGQLTMLRYLDGQKSRITFDEPKTVATAMYLLPGDDISWVASGNFTLIERVRAIYRITKPSPIALNLANLTVESFGTGEQVVLPMANDMGVALYESHQAPYTSAEIGQALYPVYNHAPFTPPYAGEELAYSLYFAGFDVVDVSKGVIAGVDTPQITMADGYLLVQFLLKSGVGYTIIDVANGVQRSLNNNDRGNTTYLVKALIIASHNLRNIFSDVRIAWAVYMIMGYEIAEAAELAAVMMMGSDMAREPGRYTANQTAMMLIVAYQEKIKLTTQQVADALATACKGQPLAYKVTEVASGVTSIAGDIAPLDMARILQACVACYHMNDVALGTYSVAYRTGSSKQQISVSNLVDVLFEVYHDVQDLHIAIAKAVVYAVANADIIELADALKRRFNYEAGNPDSYRALLNALAAAYNFRADNQDELNRLADALTHALQLSKASQDQGKYLSKALIAVNGSAVEMLLNGHALHHALGYIGDNQADVTMMIADWYYAYGLNRDMQTDVTKLAYTLAHLFSYIANKRTDILLLAKAIKDGLGYENGNLEQATLTANALKDAIPEVSVDDVIWAISEVFDLKVSPADQDKVNKLAVFIKRLLNLSGAARADVATLGKKLHALLPVTQTKGKKPTVGYGEADVTTIAIAIVYAFEFSGANQVQVNMTGIALFESFTGLDNANILATALKSAFGYIENHLEHYLAVAQSLAIVYSFKANSQDNVNKLAAALAHIYHVTSEWDDYKSGLLSAALTKVNDEPVEIQINGFAMCQVLGFSGLKGSDLIMIFRNWSLAYNINAALQADVNKLAVTAQQMFVYNTNDRDQIRLLGVGIKGGFNYEPYNLNQALLTGNALQEAMPGISRDNKIWVIRDLFGVVPPTDQSEVNKLADFIKGLLNLDAATQENVTTLSKKVCDIIYSPEINGSGQVNDRKYVNDGVNTIAKAIVHCYNFTATDAEVKITATALFASFANLYAYSLSKAIASSFNYSGYGNREHINSLGNLLTGFYSYQPIDRYSVYRLLGGLCSGLGSIPVNDKQVLLNIVYSLKNIFGNPANDGELISCTIAALISLASSTGKSLIWDAVIEIFNINIATGDDQIHNKENHQKLANLWQGVITGQAIDLHDDTEFIELAKFCINYFHFSADKIGGVVLTAFMLKKVFHRDSSVKYQALKGFMTVILEAFDITGTGTAVNAHVEKIAKATVMVFAWDWYRREKDVPPIELLISISGIFPDILPGRAGIIITYAYEIPLHAIQYVGKTVGEAFELRSYKHLEALVFALMFDQCGWNSEHFNEKMQWITGWFNIPHDKCAGDVQGASVSPVFLTSSNCIQRNLTPMEMATELQETYSRGVLNNFVFTKNMARLIMAHYNLLVPEAGVETVARCMKKLNYPRLVTWAIIRAVFNGEPESTLLQYDEIVYRVYSESGVNMDITEPEANPQLPEGFINDEQ